MAATPRSRQQQRIRRLSAPSPLAAEAMREAEGSDDSSLGSESDTVSLSDHEESSESGVVAALSKSAQASEAERGAVKRRSSVRLAGRDSGQQENTAPGVAA